MSIYELLIKNIPPALSADIEFKRDELIFRFEFSK
jgi:hypothetical protein